MLNTIVAALLLAAAAGSPRTLTVDAPKSVVRYHVVHKLHRVTGETRALEGKAVVQPDGSVMAMVRAPVAEFRSGDANRDAHMQETMDVGRFPYVVFKGVVRLDAALLPVSTGPSSAAVRMEGELDFHGVRQRVTVPLTVEAADGALRVRGSFEVSLDAYGVDRPSLLFVKIDDACRIDLDLLLRDAP